IANRAMIPFIVIDIDELSNNSLKARAERRRHARVKRIKFNRNQICLYEDFYRQVDQTEWAKAA
ncbi:unnamed protein product, partial [marine sediment metagenome]